MIVPNATIEVAKKCSFSP
ncbi:hypothetical protein D043_2982A, partial [Vibrio parahaemolyticus EKP-021]